MEAAALQPCEWGPFSTPTLGGCSEAASPVLNGQTPPALDPPLPFGIQPPATLGKGASPFLWDPCPTWQGLAVLRVPQCEP